MGRSTSHTLVALCGIPFAMATPWRSTSKSYADAPPQRRRLRADSPVPVSSYRDPTNSPLSGTRAPSPRAASFGRGWREEGPPEDLAANLGMDPWYRGRPGRRQVLEREEGGGTPPGRRNLYEDPRESPLPGARRRRATSHPGSPRPHTIPPGTATIWTASGTGSY